MSRPKAASSSKKLKFLTSAANLQGCPQDAFPEIAIVGRSNAGKSTMINGMAGARIALVSSTPGKTTLLNFYQTPQYRLVDMPGYGFASRSGSQQASWQRMIEPYLGSRGNLLGLLIVMDIRRDWSEDEDDLLAWLSPRMLPAAVVLTKADKLSRSQMLQRVREIKKQSQAETVLVTSSLKREGYPDIDDVIYKWIKGASDDPEESSS